MHHVNIEITHLCNQRCVYCVNDSGPHRTDVGFTLQDWKDFLIRAEKRGVRSAHVTGGEPFVWPHATELLAAIEDLSLGASFLSNGYRVKELSQKYPLIFSRVDVAQISLDSLDSEVHDRRRMLPGAWKQAVDAIIALSELGVRVEVSCVVSRENLDGLPQLAEFCHVTGCHLLLRPLRRVGRGENASLLDPQADALADLNAEISKRYPDVLTDDRFKYLDGIAGATRAVRSPHENISV